MAINWTAVITALMSVFGACIGSVGLWTFIDHRQQRKADERLHDSEVLKELKELRQEIAELRQVVDENEAKASRIRILRFADEVFMDMNHTKDSFDQCMSDITSYEQYCDAHKDFKNHQTGETVDFLKENYHERMKKKDFAKYGAFRNGG